MKIKGGKKKMRKHITVAMTAILVLALATVAMAADPFVGTWKLNLEKSRFPPGREWKSATHKTEARDNGLKSTYDIVEPDGKPSHVIFDFRFDGKDYPDSRGDTAAYTRIDANTLEYVEKKDGKEVWRGRVVVSKDGKTETETIKTKDAKGQPFTIIMISDKQ
jgi:hypothetical protein